MEIVFKKSNYAVSCFSTLHENYEILLDVDVDVDVDVAIYLFIKINSEFCYK